ncbi:hypothetical protein [Labrys okinawensis]|uniref:hypothetical protein n=1 Tax=Labrys okinawensis TaxID=346911 RepID=UPI0015E2C7D4|nr:hypothetical protein [Labrys okinawensis]
MAAWAWLCGMAVLSPAGSAETDVSVIAVTALRNRKIDVMRIFIAGILENIFEVKL